MSEKPEKAYVIVGYEKHENPVYANAVACIRHRFQQGEYDWSPDETDRREEARRIIYSSWAPGLQEKMAWRFLLKWSDCEYENVLKQEIIQ